MYNLECMSQLDIQTMSNLSISNMASPHSFATGTSLSSAVSPILGLLDTVAEQFIVHKDFGTVFEVCDRTLQNMSNSDQEDDRSEEIRAGFCIVGIQALAELNEWRRVLPWILQHYEHQEKIPAKLMQMCILLYSKVGEAGVMLDVARVWLQCLSNSGVAGFGTVAELYLLHVLLPLGHTQEARELILGTVGTCALTEEQRQTAVEIVDEKEHQSPTGTQSSETSLLMTKPQGTVLNKLEAILKYLYQKLLVTASGSFFHRRVFLLAFLIYMLFIRMDPALPSSFLWISKLHQLLRQMWTVLFASYYHAATGKIL